MAGNSESTKRSAATTKENYGKDHHARAGRIGGSHRTRGYFGKLKDEGRLNELSQLAKKGQEKSLQGKAEKRSESAKKGWATRKQATKEAGQSAADVREDRGQGVDK